MKKFNKFIVMAMIIGAFAIIACGNEDVTPENTTAVAKNNESQVSESTEVFRRFWRPAHYT